MADVVSAKKRWTTLEKSDLSSVIGDLLSDADPELCVKLLKTPSLKNFSGIRPKLEKSSKQWLSEFLSLGGLSCLLDGLSVLSDNRYGRFTEALEQIECVRCIKSVLNSPTGLELMTKDIALTRSLIKGENFEK